MITSQSYAFGRSRIPRLRIKSSNIQTLHLSKLPKLVSEKRTSEYTMRGKLHVRVQAVNFVDNFIDAVSALHVSNENLRGTVSLIEFK